MEEKIGHILSDYLEGQLTEEEDRIVRDIDSEGLFKIRDTASFHNCFERETYPLWL